MILRTIGSSVVFVCLFVLGCDSSDSNSSNFSTTASPGTGGQNSGTGGTQNGPGVTSGTTTDAGGTGVADTGGVAGTGGATKAFGTTGTGGVSGTGGSHLGGATTSGGAGGGGCVAPSTNGACDRDGDLFCGGYTCCPSGAPHYCPATELCYATASLAASACGSAGCFGCVTPVTGSCSSAPAGGACASEWDLYCGGNCCSSEYPYFCSTTSLCYASANQAVAACGGDSCLACQPTCSAPPNVTGSEVHDGICGGEPLAMIDGIAAYAMCDAALNSNVWSDTGASTAGVSQGPGWVETGLGRIIGKNGYQCTELSQRYFYFRFGICPWSWVAAKDMCTEPLPSTIVRTSTPVHGDLIVIPPGCDGAGLETGHVAVVDSVNGSTVYAVQQNSGTNGYGTFHTSCATCFLHAVANVGGS